MPDDYPTEEELAAWPNCATPDCQHKCCRILGSAYCSPCSARLAGVTLGEWADRIRQRRIALGLPVS